jgi:transposase
MVRWGELTNEAWERIAPLLPENGRRGKQWKDHRKVVNGILWKIRTGAPWRDLPESYGPWQTCYGRFTRWSRDGTWDRLLTHTQTKSDAVGQVGWEVSVDSTVARAHQHAAGARRTLSREDSKRGSLTRRTRRLGGAEGALAPSCTSLATGRDARFRSSSPRANVTRVRSWRRCSTLSGCRASGERDDHVRGPSTLLPTAGTASRFAGGCYGDEASRTLSPSGATSASGGRNAREGH